MNILTITSMFPSKAQPFHAVFVRNRVTRVAKHCTMKIVVPIPYFPLVGWMKRYANRKDIPKKDILEGIEVYYPRFLSIPRFFKPLDGVFLFISCWWLLKTKLKDFKFDIIDSHLAFPDGFAAIWLKKFFKKPATVTLRGHDINDLPQYPVRFKQVKYALRNADKVFSVAKALKDAAVDFGIDSDKIMVSSNGVDQSLFRPVDSLAMRKELNLPSDKNIIVSVGHLVERKGFHIILQALRIMLDAGCNKAYVVIIGGPGEEGDFSGELKRLIDELNLKDYVTMPGPQLNTYLYKWYNAADISCLASSKEGWANVLLESLACGKPVVATNVWGTPEVISSPDYGVLTERNPESLAKALTFAIDKQWNHDAIITYAREHTWENVAKRIIKQFELLIKN